MRTKTIHTDVSVARLKKLFIISAVLSIPLLWIMVSHFAWAGKMYVPGWLKNPWIQLLFATPVQFYVGGIFYRKAYQAIRKGTTNLDVLIVLGTTAAYAFSLITTIVWTNKYHEMPNIYFETSSLLITLVLIGKLLEAIAKDKASAPIRSLVQLTPATAMMAVEGQPVATTIEQIQVGHELIVHSGELIPLDGRVTRGEALIDESGVTGEHVPILKQEGDWVIGGTINKGQTFQMVVERIGQDTILSRMIRMIENSQHSKSGIQRVADSISSVYVPIVVVLSILSFAFWYILFSPGNMATALEIGIMVLVIACPCALGLANPASTITGTGRARKLGVLFKSGAFLESAHEVDTIVLNNMNLLFKQNYDLIGMYFEDEHIQRIPNLTEDRLICWLDRILENETHPVTTAIRGVLHKIVSDLPIEHFELKQLDVCPKQGLRAEIDGHVVIIGTRAFLQKHQVDYSQAEHRWTTLQKEGKSTTFIAVDGLYCGYFVTEGHLKESSVRAVGRLKQMGIEVILMTNEHRRTANALATQLGIVHVLSEISPEESVEQLRKLKTDGHQFALVGDKDTDRIALAIADIGITVGVDTDESLEFGDITILRSNLNTVADAILISHKTMNNMKQNLFWALIYNVIGIPVAAIGLLSPWVTGIVMAISSISVIVNAIGLQKVRIKKPV